ncbi:hypothetical protein ABHF33_10395 [Chitinibacter sp. FCG-7]|uniref:Sugar ABC transporter n=1 Tax=Chitinibacter mangrovi TaxID=3153927 RepID=A0AAU7F6G5_9NEIS
MIRTALRGLGFALLMPLAFALPKVTVIESYHPENSWDQAYLQGIKSKLDGVAELDFISLDTKRQPTSEHLQQASVALEQIQSRSPDLVMLGDDAALALLGPKLARMAMPTVFLGINADPTSYFSGGKIPPTITGILERPHYKRSLALIRDILPGQRRILVLMDQDRSAYILRDDLLHLGDAQLDVQQVGTFAAWQQALDAAPASYDAVIIATYQALVDEKLRNVDAAQVMRWSSANSKIPLFGFWDFQVGREATAGGVVITGFEQGAVAGGMAKTQLQKPAQRQAIRSGSSGRVMLSRTQLERWQFKIPAAIQGQISWLP